MARVSPSMAVCLTGTFCFSNSAAISLLHIDHIVTTFSCVFCLGVFCFDNSIKFYSIADLFLLPLLPTFSRSR